jgi:hypothetical protein
VTTRPGTRGDRRVSSFSPVIRLCAAMFLSSLFLHAQQPQRLVVIKVDSLPEDLLEQHLDQLPWIRHVFAERGAWVRNFYVRGISLSAPSWAMLETGQHMAIRGNAEFDRFIPGVYDYLNFFPFYFGYARSHRVDMPAVEVLDQSGMPLLSDNFPRDQRYEGMQLLQRGVRWETLTSSLRSKVARSVKELIDDWQTGFDMGEAIERQQERELIAALKDPRILYLDYFTGDLDHTIHLSNDPRSRLTLLKSVDATIGRIWTAIQASPLASSTVMVMVSDHGMNSVPGTYSQGYNLVHFFNSAAGGGHHVVTTRHPLSEYKLKGLDPFVSSVVTPSQDSFYLHNEKDWPTALLDLDGNERAAIQLRNSDLNEIQILTQQLARTDLDSRQKAAIRAGIAQIAERNLTAPELAEELDALRRAIERQKALPSSNDEDGRRRKVALETWQKDLRGYTEYLHTQLAKGVLGEPNTLAQLENYTVSLGREGVVLNTDGSLDFNRTFTRVNYFDALSNIRVRNVVQPDLGTRPVDFIAARSSDGIFLYADAQHTALITSRVENGELQLRYTPCSDWAPGFPLHLLEDPNLQVAGDRKTWLSEWHSEREWLDATHRTRYSNAVIGLHEYFSRWQTNAVPQIFQVADQRDWPLLQRFAMRRRQLVEPDLLVLASDHWNFNVRGFNPGGNHGSFLRISTHSVFMASGGGVLPGARIDRPYDSLSFVPTLLSLLGRLPENTYPGPVISEMLSDTRR